jgi:hypothetical protein
VSTVFVVVVVADAVVLQFLSLLLLFSVGTSNVQIAGLSQASFEPFKD